MLKDKVLAQKNISTTFTLLKNSAEMFFKFYIIILIFLYTKSSAAVLFYVLSQSTIYFFITFLFKNKLQDKSKQLLLISIIPFILLHLMFFVVVNNFVFIALVSVFSGVYTSITWVSFNIISSTQSQSMLSISAVNFASVLVALTSGFSLDYFSIYYVVVVGMLLYFVAVMLVFFLYDFDSGTKLANGSHGSAPINSLNQQQLAEDNKTSNFTKNSYNNSEDVALTEDAQKNEISGYNKESNYKPWLAEMFVALIFVIECLWMIFVYIKYKKFSSVGIVRALVLIGSFLSTYIIKNIKIKRIKTILAISAVLLTCLSYIYRVYAIYDATVFALSFFVGFLTPLFLLPLGQMYLKANYNYLQPLSSNFNKSSYKRLVSIPFTIVAIIIGSLSFGIVIYSLMLSYLSLQFTNKTK